MKHLDNFHNKFHHKPNLSANWLLRAVLSTCTIFVLASCGQNQSNPVSPPEARGEEINLDDQEASFDSDLSFSDFCGDVSPTNRSNYPLKVYPLYIKSESQEWSWSREAVPALVEVRTKFCPRAHMGYIRIGEEDTGNYSTSAAILGYFTNESKAKQASDQLNEQLASQKVASLDIAHIGLPIVLEDLPSSTEAVAQKAKLSSEQTKTLLAVDRYRDMGLTFDVIVPTYIPDDYALKSVDAVARPASGNLAFEPRYQLTYQSPDDSCFVVSGATGRGGAGAEDVQYAEADSPILGRVTLMYIDFVQETKKSFLSFKNFQIPTKWGGSQLYSLWDGNCRRTLSLKEAVKVVESMEYLNHPLNRVPNN
ncbi:hypothetical protein [Leptolyngbya sp. 7M]|uniref:hypothetical protein n=1 Tax=Leptolyngbya sp. 7M TaxID=2812896 RepID=UPI001B8D6336|nr:hypothetical protein [Leptolyngbya sp. 7M]QYO62059.1 hypothetical protein JVX88_18220 [Leptolyngbya sp. 7M]